MNTALLVLRLAARLALAAHGAQKLFGWWGGSGFRATNQVFGQHLRFRPASLWLTAALGTEIGGGLLLATGLLNPLGAVAGGSAMIMAIASAHWGKGFFAQNGGSELPLIYLVAAAGPGLARPGADSLDSAAGISLREPPTGIGGAAAAVAGV